MQAFHDGFAWEISPASLHPAAPGKREAEAALSSCNHLAQAARAYREARAAFEMADYARCVHLVEHAKDFADAQDLQ